MKKILALVLAFCLAITILPAAAESLLTMFGISDGEGDVQGVAGTVSGGDSELNPDSIGSIFGGTEEGEKIISEEGKDELAGPGTMAGESINAGGGEVYAGDSADLIAGLGNMLGETAEGDEIYSGDGEDVITGIGNNAVAGEDVISGLGNIFGSAEDELSGSDSMLRGSSLDLGSLGGLLGGDGSGLDLGSLGGLLGGDGSGLDLGSLGGLLGGDGSGLDLGSLGGLLGGDGSGLDLGSLGGLLGGDGSGLDLGSLSGLLGGGETAPVNTVPAESQEQFYGTWEIISLRVGGYEIGMDMLKQFGLEVTSSMTATLTADSVSLAEKDGKAETKPIAAAEFTDGALTITVEDTPARLQLTDTGNLLCTVSGAQYGVDITLDIIFARVQ